MSKATKQTAQQLAPRVTICEQNPVSFLAELEKFISLGYRIDFKADLTMVMGLNIATLALPEA